MVGWSLGLIFACSPPASDVSAPAAEPVAPRRSAEFREGEEPALLRIVAAVSLSDVLPQIGADWTAATGQPVTFTFDATSRLAKQVESGLPADVFVSADEAWMDFLAERSLIRPDTRRDLLGNSLVVVVPATGAPGQPALDGPQDLLQVGRVGVAGENVPAGRYARAALAKQWDALAPRVVSGDSVRTVLGWVAKGEVQAGVVYATDARAEPDVQVASRFPPGSHPPIVYPAAVTTTASDPEAAAAFLEYCAGPGWPRFEAAGFVAP
jgi:molybdate transport system substrate-binding protein